MELTSVSGLFSRSFSLVKARISTFLLIMLLRLGTQIGFLFVTTVAIAAFLAQAGLNLSDDAVRTAFQKAMETLREATAAQDPEAIAIAQDITRQYLPDLSNTLVMMGTGEFALPTFLGLLRSDHEVLALVTQPDRKGRGHHHHRHPIKEAALEHDISVFQPENTNSAESLGKLRSWAADLFVVAAYGQILSAELLDNPRLGVINVHASLLPKYRGLNTFQRALESGDTEHGASVHFVTDELDGGPVIIQAAVPIKAGDTIDSLVERVTEQEHIIYPMAVKWFAQSRIQMQAGKVLLDGEPLPATGYRIT